MDVPRICSSSNWASEPYYQNLNLVKRNYRTIKLWTSNVMNKSDVPSNYWLLCIIYVYYLFNHIACSKDPRFRDHRLTTDGGDHGSPTVTSEGSQPKTISPRVHNGFFRSRCNQDQSAVKPMFEFDPNENPNENFFSLPLLENGEQITEKVL